MGHAGGVRSHEAGAISPQFNPGREEAYDACNGTTRRPISPPQDRHHLLPHLWRLGRGCHGAWHRAGGARPRGPLHHLVAAVPAERSRGQHPLPRGGCLPLPALRASALRPGAGHAHGRGRRVLLARSAARPLRHSALHLRAAGAPDDGDAAGGRAPPLSADHHHAARDGHYAGGPGPLLPADYAVWHRAVRWRHRHLQLPARPHPRGLQYSGRDRGHPQLRQLRCLCPRPGEGGRDAPAIHLAGERETSQPKSCSSTSRTSARSSAFWMWSRSSPRSRPPCPRA